MLNAHETDEHGPFNGANWFLWSQPLHSIFGHVNRGEWKYEFHRGFVDELTCSYANFASAQDAILHHVPLRKITLKTWPQMQTAEYPNLRTYEFSLAGRMKTCTISQRSLMNLTPQEFEINAEGISARIVRELLAKEWPTIEFVLPDHTSTAHRF